MGDLMKKFNETLLFAMGDDVSVLSLLDHAKEDDNLLTLLKQFENSYQELGDYINKSDKRGIDMDTKTLETPEEKVSDKVVMPRYHGNRHTTMYTGKLPKGSVSNVNRTTIENWSKLGKKVRTIGKKYSR